MELLGGDTFLGCSGSVSAFAPNQEGHMTFDPGRIAACLLILPTRTRGRGLLSLPLCMEGRLCRQERLFLLGDVERLSRGLQPSAPLVRAL